MKEIIKDIKAFSLEELRSIFLASRDLVSCERDPVKDGSRENLVASRRSSLRESLKDSSKAIRRDSPAAIFLEFLSQAINLKGELLRLEGSKIFKIYHLSGMRKEENVKKAALLKICLMQGSYLAPSKNLFYTLKHTFSENEFLDSSDILDSLMTLQENNPSGSFVWLNEVIVPTLFHQQQFPPPAPNTEHYSSASKRHLEKLDNLLHYLKNALSCGNYNMCVVEHVLLVLCCSLDVPGIMCQGLFKEVMGSECRMHCLFFLMGLVEGKYSVEITAKRNKALKGKTPTYHLLQRLKSDSISTLTEELLDKLLLNKGADASEEKAEMDSPGISSLIAESHKRIVAGAIYYLKVTMLFSQ